MQHVCKCAVIRDIPARQRLQTHRWPTSYWPASALTAPKNIFLSQTKVGSQHARDAWCGKANDYANGIILLRVHVLSVHLAQYRQTYVGSIHAVGIMLRAVVSCISLCGRYRMQARECQGVCG